MEAVSLSEFLRLTQLSEKDLLLLLERGELKTFTSNLGEVKIDISSLTPEQLARRGFQSGVPEIDAGQDLLEECIASEILSALDELLEEGLEMALRWQAEKGKERSEKPI